MSFKIPISPVSCNNQHWAGNVAQQHCGRSPPQALGSVPSACLPNPPVTVSAPLPAATTEMGNLKYYIQIILNCIVQKKSKNTHPHIKFFLFKPNSTADQT